MFENLHAKCKILTMENNLTSYLSNETSFSESSVERLFLIIFTTMYYLFDRECDKKGVRSGSEEGKQKMKQRSLFGVIVKGNTKFYCI